MSYEVELKYRLANPDLLVARLAQRGAVSGPPTSMEDLYLNHPSRDFGQTHEALRIRRVGTENRITYKGPRLSGPTKTRQEIELPFASGDTAFEELSRLFAHLGFQPVATVRKTRTIFQLTEAGQPVEIAVDFAEGLGQFAEIEAQAAVAGELPAAQAAVLAVAAQVGLTEVEPRTYLRMVLEKQGHLR